ncbi:hypothetical protein [Leifsonia sp. NPDC058248]|uniref:hypothetical protein n=1 Tax=Leifsonia sp. NPDC058248 TaxID=3346402 RepID=UPI0036DBF07D
MVGVIVAILGVYNTYRTHAPDGLRVGKAIRSRLRLIAIRFGSWVADIFKPHRPETPKGPKLRWSGVSAYGPVADTRTYELPPDIRDQIAILTRYIQEDFATLAKVESEAGHTKHVVERLEAELQRVEKTSQAQMQAGLRDNALGGLGVAALGLAITAVGLALTFPSYF